MQVSSSYAAAVLSRQSSCMQPQLQPTLLADAHDDVAHNGGHVWRHKCLLYGLWVERRRHLDDCMGSAALAAGRRLADRHYAGEARWRRGRGDDEVARRHRASHSRRGSGLRAACGRSAGGKHASVGAFGIEASTHTLHACCELAGLRLCGGLKVGAWLVDDDV